MKFKDFDCVGDEAPSPASGTNPFDNPCIQPSTGKIPTTPGENAKNSTAGESMSKAQPSVKKGSGYYK